MNILLYVICYLTLPFFFFNNPLPTAIYTLSLHDALPICCFAAGFGSTDIAVTFATGRTWFKVPETIRINLRGALPPGIFPKDLALQRSEEHTSELQSRENLVCRLLLEKKKKSSS